jgi:hypothetical protein
MTVIQDDHCFDHKNQRSITYSIIDRVSDIICDFLSIGSVNLWLISPVTLYIADQDPSASAGMTFCPNEHC